MENEKKTKEMPTEAAPAVSEEIAPQEHRLMAALSYVHILCLVPLLTQRDNEFVQYHAKQGLVLFVVEVIVFMGFFSIILTWLSPILLLATFVGSVAGIIFALQGKKQDLPGVQWVVEKLNI